MDALRLRAGGRGGDALCQSPAIQSSSFSAVERWMEIQGHPLHPYWIRMKGAPLHVWRESIFRKLGNCFGRTLEVDWQTILQENLQFVCVKVLLDDSWQFPSKNPLWLDDLSTLVTVEEESKDTSVELEMSLDCKFCNKPISNSTTVDNDDVTLKFSNFKITLSAHEFELIFEGRPGMADPTGARSSDMLFAQDLDLSAVIESGGVSSQKEVSVAY